MEEARERMNCAASAVCDGLRQIGDASYAILPRDIAHALADLKKALLNNVRSAIDWELSWIDERVAGGDRLRDEWRESCKGDQAGEAADSAI